MTNTDAPKLKRVVWGTATITAFNVKANDKHKNFDVRLNFSLINKYIKFGINAEDVIEDTTAKTKDKQYKINIKLNYQYYYQLRTKEQDQFKTVTSSYITGLDLIKVLAELEDSNLKQQLKK